MGLTGRHFLFAIFWILTSSVCFAGQVSINASVDKNTAALDDVVQYTITISGQGINNASVPKAPGFSGLKVVSRSQSSNISIINGQVSTACLYTYILQPVKEGAADIGEASVTIGKNTYKSQPISITITKPTGEPKQSSSRHSRWAVSPSGIWDELKDSFGEARNSPHSAESITDPILAATTLSRYTCYVNQMVILTFTFYRRVNLMESPGYTPPSTIGFWSMELPSSKDEKYETIKGVRYLTQRLKTALFPTQSGELTISPATVIARLDPFSAPITITTKPIKIKVLPLPEHERYKTPAVGRFTISATVDKKEIERGKPFTLKVKIKGDGNINTIPEPLIRLDDNFKKLSCNATNNIIKGFDSVSGSKTFEYVIMPVREGSGNVGPANLAYFDPSIGKYIELSSKPSKIKVLSSNIPLPEEKTEKGTQSSEKPVVRIDKGIILKLLMAILIIILLGIIGFLIKWAISKYRKYLHSDPIKMRQGLAMKKARGGLNKAKALLKDGRLKESVAMVFDAVVHYLGDRYNFTSTGITHDQLKDILTQQGIAPDVMQGIDNFILECDFIRFTPSSLDKGKVDEIIKIAQGLIMTRV